MRRAHLIAHRLRRRAGRGAVARQAGAGDARHHRAARGGRGRHGAPGRHRHRAASSARPTRLLDDARRLRRHGSRHNPYGDGQRRPHRIVREPSLRAWKTVQPHCRRSASAISACRPPPCSPSRGVDVVGVDVEPRRRRRPSTAAASTFVEPDLDALVRRVVESGKLRATAEAGAGRRRSSSPCRRRFTATAARSPTCRYVEAAARADRPGAAPGNLVILESTSPVGTTERMAAIARRAAPGPHLPAAAGRDGADVQVAYCPERVLPGRILQELVNNDRVIGGMTRSCAAARARPLPDRSCAASACVTDARTAEMAKLTENAFRDVNIAFANELSLHLRPARHQRLGADRARQPHPRVNILRPAPASAATASRSTRGSSSPPRPTRRS